IILNISHRLFALANFLHSGEAKEWLMTETGGDYVLVNEAVLRAAAQAPLMEAEYIRDMTFDSRTVMPIVLQEADAEGKAEAGRDRNLWPNLKAVVEKPGICSS